MVTLGWEKNWELPAICCGVSVLVKLKLMVWPDASGVVATHSMAKPPPEG